MRRLGAQPLTGAEKQRRHRERVKARLAEAERLKALLADGRADSTPSLAAVYDHLLNDLGATLEERESLGAQVGAVQIELRAVLEARARNDLEHLRSRLRRRKSSLLARLDANKPRGN